MRLPDVLPPDEESALRDRYWRPAPGDACVDVGSFQGSYSLPALAAGATVCAVDAREWTLLELRDRARAHGLDDGLLTTVHAALSDGEPYPPGLLEAIRTGPAPSRDMAPEGAPWSTLDEVWQGLGDGRLDWLKVDVEGGELAVLRGGVETLRRHHPRLLVEDHSQVYPWVAERGDAARVLALLAELGYEAHELGGGYPDWVVAW